MSQNEINRIASELQAFVLKNFISTCYNVDDNASNYQVEQYRKAYNIIHQFYNASPNALDSLLNSRNIPIVPTIEDVGETGHMQNIGTSASMCLQELKKLDNQPHQSDTTVKQLVEKFLTIVMHQAQAQVGSFTRNSAFSNAVNSQQSAELAGIISRDLFTPYFEEYNALLLKKREEFESFTVNAKAEFEQLSKSTKDELNQFFLNTKTSADEAAKNAQTAKETSATIMTQLNEATKSANDATKAAKNATKAATAATTAATAATTAAEDAKETSKNMLPNMLSALGIFVGIVVAVVACYLSVLLAQHSESSIGLEYYSRPFEFMQYLLMGHITLTVVFLLMYLISRISGHSLACICVRRDAEGIDGGCTKCRHKCSPLVRFKLRYPYLYYINFVCFLGYVVLALWQFINIYYRTQLDNWILSHPLVTIIIAGVLFIVILTIVFSIFGFKKRSPREKAKKKRKTTVQVKVKAN